MNKLKKEYTWGIGLEHETQFFHYPKKIKNFKNIILAPKEGIIINILKKN